LKSQPLWGWLWPAARLGRLSLGEEKPEEELMGEGYLVITSKLFGISIIDRHRGRLYVETKKILFGRG